MPISLQGSPYDIQPTRITYPRKLKFLTFSTSYPTAMSDTGDKTSNFRHSGTRASNLPEPSDHAPSREGNGGALPIGGIVVAAGVLVIGIVAFVARKATK